jgi:ATP-dependent Clp protease ATP-binding subunit ClpA
MSWTDAVVDFLLEREFSSKYGARALKRAIKDWIEKPLSEDMLRGQVGAVGVCVDEGHIVLQWKQ